MALAARCNGENGSRLVFHSVAREVRSMRRLLALAGLAVAAWTMTGSAQTLLFVQPGDLVWAGAFRLPAGNFGGSSFGYGGWALAYNAANDSLYVVGHDFQQNVAEITIPAPGMGSILGQLPFASVRQVFADATEGRMSQIGGYPKYRIGGLLVHGGRLIGAAYSFFDTAHSAVASHFTHSLNLAATGTVTGMHRVGSTSINPAFYGGNMGDVPAAWRTALGSPAITGECCLSIITRTSFGPSAFAFDPAQLGVVNPTPATALVYYPEQHVLQPWNANYTFEFNGTTEMAGAFIPEGTRSLLFIGRQGSGKFCYRCGDPDLYCPGDLQAPPYHVQVWAYDLNELVQVKNGQKQPWEPRPYAIWQLTGNTASSPLPFFTSCMSVRGLAYDPGGNRIWIASQRADGDNPVIHMFRYSRPTAPPRAPTDLQVIR
jgi:hypothetical protein